MKTTNNNNRPAWELPIQGKKETFADFMERCDKANDSFEKHFTNLVDNVNKSTRTVEAINKKLLGYANGK